MRDLAKMSLIILLIGLLFICWGYMIKSMDTVKQEQVLKQYNNKTINSITSDGGIMIISFTTGETLEIEAYKRHLEYK